VQRILKKDNEIRDFSTSNFFILLEIFESLLFTGVISFLTIEFYVQFHLQLRTAGKNYVQMFRSMYKTTKNRPNSKDENR